jgi:hypothetical protein
VPLIAVPLNELPLKAMPLNAVPVIAESDDLGLDVALSTHGSFYFNTRYCSNPNT